MEKLGIAKEDLLKELKNEYQILRRKETEGLTKQAFPYEEIKKMRGQIQEIQSKIDEISREIIG